MGVPNQEPPRWAQPPGPVPQDARPDASPEPQRHVAGWPVLPSSAPASDPDPHGDAIPWPHGGPGPGPHGDPALAYGGAGHPGPGPGAYGYDSGFGFYGDPGQGLATPELDRLARPLYGASFGQAVSRFFRKYAVFRGLASRSEYLWATLFQFCVFLLLVVLSVLADSAGAGQGVVSLLLVAWMLGTIVPSISLGVRRLHDAGQTGWLYLLCLVPYLGSLIVLILCCQPTSAAAARYDV